MKNISIKYLLSFSSIFILLICCEKKETQYYYLNDNSKHYATFQYGSYWIYKNDSTGIEDSVYVINIDRDFDHHYPDDEYAEEYISCVANSRFDSSLKIIYKIQSGNGLTDFDISFYYCCDTLNTGWGITSYLNNNTADRFIDPLANVITPIQSLSLNNSTYNNIYQFTRGHISGIFSQLDIDSASVFVVKDIGIIKWIVRFENNSVASWSLLRRNIIL